MQCAVCSNERTQKNIKTSPVFMTSEVFILKNNEEKLNQKVSRAVVWRCRL
jgi:hypothetical protein